MKTILQLLKNAFAGLLSSSRGTRDSSQVGLEGSAGSGVSNNGWSTVVLIVLLFGAGFSVGYFAHTPKVITQADVVYLPGIPDTVRIPVKPLVGASIPGSSHTVYTGELEPITIVSMPDYVETEVIINEPEYSGRIRATAYPSVVNDSLIITLPIEYNIQPKQLYITQVDTLLKTIEEPRPWITEPEVVAGGVSIFWLAIIIFL